MRKLMFSCFVLAGILTGGRALAEEKAKFEYKLLNMTMAISSGSVEKKLNSLAEEGWEVAAAGYQMIILKREISSTK